MHGLWLAEGYGLDFQTEHVITDEMSDSSACLDIGELPDKV